MAFFVSTAALAGAFVLEEKWIWLIALAANAVFGIGIHRRGWASAWVVMQVALSATSGISALLALAATAFALAYWDLEAYHRMLRGTRQIFSHEAMARSHQLSLLSALAIGSLSGLVAIGVPLRLSFMSAVLLAALALIGITTMTNRARSNSN